MEQKDKIRAMRRMINILTERCDEGIHMDSVMDGSGECGKFYIPFHMKSKEFGIQAALMQLELLEEDLEDALKSFMMIEKQYLQPYESCPVACLQYCELSEFEQ